MALSRAKKMRMYDFDDFARKEITFYQCQSGYHPRSVKEIVVWSRKDHLSLRYRLVDSTTRETVARGLCERKGENTWGRIDWVIDITAFRRHGSYSLEIPAGGKQYQSAPFTIDPACYEILTEKAAKHIFLKRCGVFCHGHDADVRSLDQADFGRLLGHRDVSGGWHDAHDDNKWINSVWNVIYGLCEIHDRLKPRWKGTNEPLPYLLAEAWWEVEFLLKAQNDDGSLLFGVFEWYPDRQGGRKVNRVHTELNYYDDLARDRRVAIDLWDPRHRAQFLGWTSLPPKPQAGYQGYRDHAYLAAAIARFARSVARYDAAISRRCLKTVGRTLKFLAGQPCPDSQFLDSQSGLALAKMDLFINRPTRALVAQIELHLREILALQQPEGHFHSSRGFPGLEMNSEETKDFWYTATFPYSYVMPLVKYLDAFPHGRLSAQVRESFQRFVEFAHRHTRQTCFGQLVPMSVSDSHVVIRRGSSGAHCLSIASLFLAAGRLLKKTKYLTAGEKNIQWMFGANPRAMSFMTDEGYRNIGQYVAFHNGVATRGFAFYNHNRDMRWGMSSGIRGSVGDVPNQPDNYPNAGDSMKHLYQHHGQEEWLLITGWFLLAAVEMSACLRQWS